MIERLRLSQDVDDVDTFARPSGPDYHGVLRRLRVALADESPAADQIAVGALKDELRVLQVTDRRGGKGQDVGDERVVVVMPQRGIPAVGPARPGAGEQVTGGGFE